MLDYYLGVLKTSGLAEAATIVHICINSESAAVVREASQIVNSALPNAIVTAVVGNEFEYRGVWQTWTYGRDSTNMGAGNTVILYFHSKGVTQVSYILKPNGIC